MTTTKMKPSPYQQAIIDAVVAGDQNVAVQARAGSGKTTLLKMVATELVDQGHSCLFVAFVKRVADELKAKLPRAVKCQTINSYGHQALLMNLGDVVLDKNKGYQLARPYSRALEKDTVISGIKQLKQVYDYCRSTLTEPTPEHLEQMVSDYGLDLPFYSTRAKWQVLADVVGEILQAGVDLTLRERVIDFNDQIYLPLLWQDQFVFPKYDWVAIDEAQDQSEAKLQLLSKALNDDSRLIAVGDPAQAVFLFAGARCDSMDTITTRFGCVEYPLPVCYRCPGSHVQLAQQWVPDIEPADGAKDGVIRTVAKVSVLDELDQHDLVICRKASPLVKLCLDLISRGKKAVVKGDDNLVNVLSAIIDDVGTRLAKADDPYTRFLYHARAYYDDRVRAIKDEPDYEDRVVRLNDHCTAVKEIYHAFDVTSCAQLKTRLQGLFNDDRGAVVLMTIHKAKGAEADRVYILHPSADDIALDRPTMTAEQLEQEQNLTYVAVTRSKNELVFVKP